MKSFQFIIIVFFLVVVALNIFFIINSLKCNRGIGEVQSTLQEWGLDN